MPRSRAEYWREWRARNRVRWNAYKAKWKREHYVKVKDRDPNNPAHQKIGEQQRKWHQTHKAKKEGNDKWKALGE